MKMHGDNLAKFIDGEVAYMLQNRDFAPVWIFVNRKMWDIRALDSIENTVSTNRALGLLELTPLQAAETFSDSLEAKFGLEELNKLPTTATVHGVQVEFEWKLFGSPVDSEAGWLTMTGNSPDPLTMFYDVIWKGFAYVKLSIANAPR
jgi:hypothetical protein